MFSEIVTLPTLQKFLNTCEKFWIKKALSENETLKFKSNCMAFYRDKTFERINLFYKNFKKNDNAEIINGDKVPTLETLLNLIDWEWISEGAPGRYHGDFHFENIIYSNEKKFIFLDWRQNFAGDLFVGDIYYDLAKLLHGLIVNHGVITSNLYSASWVGNQINFQLTKKDILMKSMERLEAWIIEKKYDLKKVKMLTALIFLNIAPLHHRPYSFLLYGLGKSMLNRNYHDNQISYFSSEFNIANYFNYFFIFL